MMRDLIDRQAAIEEIKRCESADSYDFNNGLICALNAIADIPSAQPRTKCIAEIKISKEDLDELVAEKVEEIKAAQPKPQWIPCGKRLPEELEEVNVTWVNHKPEPYYDFVKDKPFTASAVYYKGDWYWYSSVCTDLLAERGKNEMDKIDDAIEITAWMPLPEPYKERKDDEN